VTPFAYWSAVLTVLDEAPSDKERQQSLDNCIELPKGVSVGLKG
jgi:hypothetical protein